MMVKNERENNAVPTLDDRLVVPEAVVSDKTCRFFGESLEETKVVPSGFTKQNKHVETRFPQNYFHYLADLKHVFAEDFCDHKEASPVGCPPNHNTV